MLTDLRGSWNHYSAYKIVKFDRWRQRKHKICNSLGKILLLTSLSQNPPVMLRKARIQILGQHYNNLNHKTEDLNFQPRLSF